MILHSVTLESLYAPVLCEMAVVIHLCFYSGRTERWQEQEMEIRSVVIANNIIHLHETQRRVEGQGNDAVSISTSNTAQVENNVGLSFWMELW